jgi:TatD DNase family protein
VQEQWFDAQVKLAMQLQKPLFMHCRDAGEQLQQVVLLQVRYMFLI